jgi:hypothetical protein
MLAFIAKISFDEKKDTKRVNETVKALQDRLERRLIV